MTNKKDGPTWQFYWDASVFLSAINANPDRLPVIQAILDDCDEGKSNIYTSMLSITEVAFATTEKDSGVLDEQAEKAIEKLWLPPSPIKLVEVHGPILQDAKALMRDGITRGFALKPADAIHLATAKRLQVDRVHTYDPKWLKYGDIIGCTISEPAIDRIAFTQ